MLEDRQNTMIQTQHPEIHAKRQFFFFRQKLPFLVYAYKMVHTCHFLEFLLSACTASKRHIGLCLYFFERSLKQSLYFCRRQGLVPPRPAWLCKGACSSVSRLIAMSVLSHIRQGGKKVQ